MPTINFPTGDFVTTTLTGGGIDSTQTTATIGAGLTLPATNGVLVIDYDSTAAKLQPSGPETVVYGAYDTGTGALTGLIRGKAGTGVAGVSGVTHNNLASVQCSSSSVLYTEVSDRLTAVQAGATLALVTGWQDPAETHTYASGTTVTVPAGALTKYQVGDKYKVTQNVPLTTVYNLDTNSNSQIGSYNGTDTAISYATPGKFGAGCATFTAASSSKILIADNAVFKPTTAFTLGLWFKTGTTGTEKQLFQSYSQNSAVAGIRARITAANVLQIVIGKNTGTTAGTDYTTTTCPTNTICDGNWHYVVFSYQSNFIRIYLDGNLEYSGYTIQPAYAALNSNHIRIGSGSDAGSDAAGVFMNGSIDDLFFINGFAVDQYWVAAKYAQATAQGIANITPTYQGYITNVANTLLTVTGGADYVLYNSTLSSPYYSHANPVGFPKNFNFTTVAASVTGAITSYTVNKATLVMLSPKFYRIDYDVTITNQGTGTGALLILTLPINADAHTFPYPLTGREVAGPGFGLTGQILSSDAGKLLVCKYDGSGIVATNSRFSVSFSYFSA